MTMDRIEYHRAGQGPATLLVPPNQFQHELQRLKSDPQVTLPLLQRLQNVRRHV